MDKEEAGANWAMTGVALLLGVVAVAASCGSKAEENASRWVSEDRARLDRLESMHQIDSRGLPAGGFKHPSAHGDAVK